MRQSNIPWMVIVFCLSALLGYMVGRDHRQRSQSHHNQSSPSIVLSQTIKANE